MDPTVPATDPPIIDPATVGVPGPVESAGTGTNASNTSTSSSTAATPAAGVMPAIAQQNDALMSAAGDQKAVGDAQALADSQKADVLGQDADLARQQAADAAADHQQYLDRVETARGQQAAAEKALDGAGYHDYWGSQSTGHKILHNLGALFTGASGNTAAMQAFNENTQAEIKQDFDQQRAGLAQKLEVARLKGQNVSDLYSQWQSELGASKVKESKAHEAVAAKLAEVSQRAGIPVAQLQNNVAYKTLVGQAAAKKVEALQHYDRSNTSAQNATIANTTENKITDQKGPKVTKDQLEANASLADMTPDAQSLVKNPLTPDELKTLSKRLTTSAKEPTGIGNRLIDGVEDLASKKLTPEQEERIATAQRLVGRLNPLVGEKRTPESDLAVAMSRLPITTDKDTTKADRLLQTIRAQAYKTTNPTAFAKAATAPVAAPASAPQPGTPSPAPGPASYSPAILAKAQKAMSDPKAPAAAKIAAARVLDAAKAK
jgi:hypothetical protein